MTFDVSKFQERYKKRAEAVGVAPLPARRPTPAQRKEWQNEIQEKEKQQR